MSAVSNLSEDNQVQNNLEELSGLIQTLGMTVVGQLVQRRHRISPKYFLGAGKIEELKALAEGHRASYLVFCQDLSPPQVRNIESLTSTTVLDRTDVILEIFSRHAKTNQAKTQVEIARLEYLLPRLSGAWSHFQRQKGGSVRSRGMGEKQIEVDRRQARERINRLQTKLRQIERERTVQRRSRRDQYKVSLVGYTNSGKTTLMKMLTDTETEGQDALFATLDTTVRRIDAHSKPKLLLSDTVGLIRDLPHGLVESFRSTLVEIAEADLILQVVDCSSDHYREHMRSCQQTLEDVGAEHIPQIVVFNKVDKIHDALLPRILKLAYRDSCVISAFNLEDIENLKQQVYRFFRSQFTTVDLRIPVSDHGAQSLVYQSCIILDSHYDDSHVQFRVQSPDSTVQQLKGYKVFLSEEQRHGSPRS